MSHVVFGVIVAIILLLMLVYYVYRCWTDADDQDPGGGGDTVGQPRRRTQQLDVEMAAPVRTAEPPPLVCTYRKADGWRESSCGVCLAELDDGDAVRVLPACMHYFHTSCVGEWLRAKATCPLCRAPLIAPAANATA